MHHFALRTSLCALFMSVSASSAFSATLTTLHTFGGAGKGVNPYAGLISDGAGTLYGTTTNGGATGSGTIYKFDLATNTLTYIASLDGNATGANPLSTLILDPSGNLYGTATSGGANFAGTLFKVAAGSNTVTNLFNFNNTPNGRLPSGPLLMTASGDILGTFAGFGATNSGNGGIFRYAPSTSTMTLAFNYTGTANGANPFAGLARDSAGNFYLPTIAGGASNAGVVTKFDADTLVSSTVATFNTTNGAVSHSTLVIDAAGNMFGTTRQGGASGKGTVYKIAAGSNTITTLATFTGTNGSEPFCSLIMDAAGNLYGTTTTGGTGNAGTVFKVDGATSALTTLFNFTALTNGQAPRGTLWADASGVLYGTTAQGGSTTAGTIFKLADTGFVVPEPTAFAALAVGWVFGRRRRK